MTWRLDWKVEPMTPRDFPEVRRIYEAGIATGMATFETQAPGWETWNGKHLPCCRLVVRDGERLAGWAALSPVSSRPAYCGVAEVSVYVDPAHWGRGVGNALLDSLIPASEASGIWTLQAAIFLENEASVALHGKNGFRIVGTREKIGQLHGQWHDTVLMERRSHNFSD